MWRYSLTSKTSSYIAAKFRKLPGNLLYIPVEVVLFPLDPIKPRLDPVKPRRQHTPQEQADRYHGNNDDEGVQAHAELHVQPKLLQDRQGSRHAPQRVRVAKSDCQAKPHGTESFRGPRLR